MDATLNIIVRVAARQAQQQLNATAASVRGVSAAANNVTGLTRYLGALKQAGMAQANFAANLQTNALINHGKNLNWVGRQLIYNFTLPLALAGAALFKFNMDLERSMVQVKKVYGDLSYSQERVDAETNALAKSFNLLSTAFGVNQVEVIDIAAAWASAGSAGRGLAENTKATMEAMILGEMEATEATQALIAIQATWQLSTYDSAGGVSELTQALAIMNVVENETAIRMQGLIDVFVRAGGAARTAGVTIQELSALAAVLVPATGSAAQAGNSLKTIISRLQAPTQQTIDLLEEIGFTVADPDWLGKTATGKLEALADQWDGLSTAQRTYASSILASRWQVNRFDVLLNDMSSDMGIYDKALRVASMSAKELATIYDKELAAVLDSNPRKWDIMTNAIRNSLASAFIPLIPAIMSVVGFISQLATKFSQLDPGIQRMVLFGLVTVALVGPLLSLAGSTMQLIGVFHVFFKAIGGVAQLFAWAMLSMGRSLKMFAFIFSKVFGMIQAILIRLVPLVLGLGAPFWIALAAVVAVGTAIALVLTTDIEEPVVRMVKNVASWLARLPQVFVNVFNGVIRVLQRAVEIIIDLLSYLNPFARHSPSLVDNVKAGISVILDEYEKLKTIPKTVASALASLSAFQSTASVDVTGFRSTELNNMVSDVAEYNPAAGEAAADMVDNIMALEALLPGLSAEISKQRLEVASLTVAYDQAAAAVEDAEKVLSSISDQMDIVSDQISEAHNRLDELANTKINGMTAMEDAIFANSMAQKQLNLELLRFEQAGYTIDGIQDKMAALNGEIEMLRGEQETLRLAGAGSDILGVYEDQIDALEAQRGPLNDIADQIQEIEDALASLDIEGQILELTQSITFDPLLREIEKLVEGVEEMSFDDIMAGISEQQRVITDLEAAYVQLEAAEKAAQGVVDSTTAKRDAIGDQLDAEKDKLDLLESAYSDIKALISEMESAMGDYVQAAEAAAQVDKAAKEAAAGGESLFAAAEGVDYEIAGGDTVLGAEGGLIDIEEFNKEMEARIQEALEGMGNIDISAIWGNLKERIFAWFRSIPQWIKDNWVRITLAVLAGAIVAVFGAPALVVAAVAGLAYFGAALLKPIWDWVYLHILTPIGNALGAIGIWIGSNVLQPIMDFFTMLGGYITGFWDSVIWPILEVMGAAFQFFGRIIATVWEGVWGVIDWAWGLILGVFSSLYNWIKEYIVPIFQLFLAVGLIVFKLIQLGAQAMGEILGEVFSWIWGIIQRLGGWFRWLWDRVWEVFVWIGDGARALWRDYIEPPFNGIVGFLGDVWEQMSDIFSTFGEILAPIGEALRGLYNSVIKPVMSGIGMAFASVWNGILAATSTAINFFIMAFNAIARGVNAVAGLLNIDYSISTMDHVTFDSLRFDTGMFAGSDKAVNGSPGGGGSGTTRYMAEGGVLGKMGGAVKQARAIVGEGSNIHPEYVIPTDPRYRQRAMGLYTELGHTMGLDGEGRSNMDIFGIGGAVSKGFSAAKGALGAVGGFIKDGAIAALWTPAKAAIDAAMNLIPEGFIRNVGKGLLGAVDGWVRGTDNAWNEEAALRKPPAPTEGAGSWKVIPDMLRQMGVPHKILSTFRPNAVTRITGNPSWHALDRAIDLSGPTGMINYRPNDLLAINRAIYDAYKPYLKEMIYGGPGAKNVFRGRDHAFSNALMGEHINHVHAALARGGFVVPRTTGGSLFRIGEGLHDEAVQVMPLHGGATSGGGDTNKEFNFYGDLSFPNITNPDDAERFISNLEALAG